MKDDVLPVGPASECERAIALGIEALRSAPVRFASVPERLALVELRYQGTLHEWRLTFKARALIPSSDKESIGAGGELFVSVDLRAGTACVTGLGE